MLAFGEDLLIGVRAGMAVPEIRYGGNELLLDLARFAQFAADVQSPQADEPMRTQIRCL